jgi:methanogenic corrinoid protein MtbC1
VAVGVSISDIGRIAAAAEVVDALRERVSVPVLVGGPATDDGTARALGADGWAPDAVAAAELVLARRDGQH